MLAAWEWGQLSGFAARSQRVCWRCCVVCYWRDAILLPEYHHTNIRQPLVEMSLWASLMVGCRATAGAILSRFGGNLAQLKNIASHIFGLLTIVPPFSVCWRCVGNMTRIITVAQYGYFMS